MIKDYNRKIDRDNNSRIDLKVSVSLFALLVMRQQQQQQQ